MCQQFGELEDAQPVLETRYVGLIDVAPQDLSSLCSCSFRVVPAPRRLPAAPSQDKRREEFWSASNLFSGRSILEDVQCRHTLFGFALHVCVGHHTNLANSSTYEL